jgi:hypothetical protein
VARPQTPHVPSCRLKLGIPARSPRVRAENTREISRVHGSWGERDESRSWRRDGTPEPGGDDDTERKSQLTNLSGIKQTRVLRGWQALQGWSIPSSRGIRWYAVTRSFGELVRSPLYRGKSQHVKSTPSIMTIEGIFGQI